MADKNGDDFEKQAAIKKWKISYALLHNCNPTDGMIKNMNKLSIGAIESMALKLRKKYYEG